MSNDKTYTKREVEQLLHQQRKAIAEKLIPKRTNMAQEVEYQRILNHKIII